MALSKSEIGLVFAVALISIPNLCLAEGNPRREEEVLTDKRLPPVIPGESVPDGQGRSKVWSTSGPVPVAPGVDPWKGETNSALKEVPGGVGVIVDDYRDQRGQDAPVDTEREVVK